MWLAYAALGAVGTALYYVFPQWETQIWTALGMSSAAATVIGVRVHRPRQRLAWYLLAAALFAFVSGDLIFYILTKFMGQDDPFPSLADVFYLITYPLFAGGFVLMIRARSATRDVLSLIDGLIVTTGVALLSWTYLVTPTWQAGGSSMQRVVSVTYPLMDVLVIAMLARLLASGGLRSRALQMLTLGALGLIAADVAYGLIQLNGVWANGTPVDSGWAIFYVAWGAAALHPSMTRLTEIVPVADIRFGPMRVAVLGSAAVIGPAILVIGSIRHTSIHAATVGVFSAALFVLVVLRMASVLSVHEQSVRREGALRSSSEALVAAQQLPDVYSAAVGSIPCLIAGDLVASASVYVADEQDISLAAGDDYPDESELHLLWMVARAGGCLTKGGTLSVTPLRFDGEDRGMIVVTSQRPLSASHHHALLTLASQVALAGESVRLTEHLNKARSEAQFRGMIQNASDVIIVVDSDGVVTYGTPSLRRRLGYDVVDVLGTDLRTIVHPDDQPLADTLLTAIPRGSMRPSGTSDWRIRHADGHYLFFEVVSSELLDESAVKGTVFTMRDVTHRRALEKQLEHQAFHDSLTGLPNRSLFQDRVESALERASRNGTILAMAMVDLDDFKLVNDTRGHAAGDSLLIEVAIRLQASFRAGVTLARLGGDEFAILLEDLRTESDTAGVPDRLLRPFAEPFFVDGEEIAVSASVGLAITGGNTIARDREELLRCADLALYAAKERGKGRVQQYHDELHSRMMKRLTQRAELTRALESGEFVLNYQPIVCIDTSKIVGSEVLVRWAHPTRGLVPPSEFIAFTEETGLIVDLGRWIIDRACAQWREWTDGGLGYHRLSINVSPRQLEEPTFADDVMTAMHTYRIPRGTLVLELTESMFALEAPSIARQLTELRDAGIRIAVDDFGTGYSSLSYLRRFPIDILKVDRSFVNDLGIGDTDGGALAHAIVSLAHALHLEVVAEGIETVAQRDELMQMGCSLGQGFLYARPLIPAAMLAELNAPSPRELPAPAHQANGQYGSHFRVVPGGLENAG